MRNIKFVYESMTYKETLFFIAQCLTISLEEKNKEVILLKLQSEEINWEAVIKVSTGHYVLPALYCNLKRVKFLKYLPEDLVGYMKQLNNLNRERNTKIITEAKELNKLLLANNITPIFLKCTGNLIEGLYDDISERMVGDIDFICSKDDHPKAIKILSDNGYGTVVKEKYNFPEFKHHPRLKKKNKIAAVEIHKELLSENYAHEFNYSIILEDIQKINDATVLSFEHQFALSIISKQINDNGFHYKDMALRNAYDVFLLSKKTNGENSFSKFDTLKNPLNCFLAISYVAFGEIDSLKYHKTKETENYLSLFDSLLLNEKKRKSRIKLEYRKLFIKERLSLLYKSLFNKEHRDWLLKRISDKNWQRKKMVQLGLKKSKF